jgi:putative molybdopterin biosynthesis protein
MAQADPDDTFLTVAEVAEMLKLNQQTVRNWIDRGQLSATRVGRRVRIRRSDLDRIVQAGYGQATASVSATGSAGPSQSAEDFWNGEAVGVAVPPPLAGEP